MIDPIILLIKVAVLVLMIVPGFLLAKFKMLSEGFGKSLSNLILYAAQPALIISGFVSVDFNTEVIARMVAIFLLAIVSHLLFYLIGRLVFHGAPLARKRVLIFSTVFTNAGYMGIPLLESLFLDTYPEVALYGSVYVTAFNIFLWSLGAYLYTDDKKYISVKKMLINPATICTFIGLGIFLLSAIPGVRDAVIVPYVRDADSVVWALLSGLKGLVAPLSMFLIGLRISELDLRRAFKDKYLYLNILVGLFAVPAIAFAAVKLVSLTGLYHDALTASVLIMSAAAPAATATGMFAEKFDGDGVYASLIVSVTSVLCVITMPLVCMLSLLY